MSDPNSIADIFDVQAQFVPPVANGRFGFGNPTFIAEFAANPSFPGRVKAYTGTISQKLAALVADGFATTSDVYRQVQTANVQDGPARTIYVGRKDAADADWGVAVQAVRNAALADGLSFYAFTTTTRDPLEIEAIADYLEGVPDEPVFAFYLAQTDDINVFNDAPGNVARNILAKNYSRTALLWHDPETASGYGPAVLESVTGPFNIPNASTVQLRVNDGATQTFTFNATPAVITGSNTETFAVANGDQLIFAVNGGSNQTITYSAAAASVTCANAETYNFVDGLTLSVRVDGGAPQSVIFNGTAGSVDTGAEPYAFLAPDTITFSIDGGANQILTPGVGATTAALLKDAIDAQITGVTTEIIAGPAVRITSNRLGTSSDVEIVAGSANALTESGLSVGNNNGTGFAAFLDVATAAEVAAEINADTTGCTAASVSGQVRITSDLVGTLSRIQVTGGTANAVLNFDTNEAAGSGDFADASAATALEMIAPINSGATGVVASVSAGAVRLTSTQLGTGSIVDVAASTVATTLGLSLTAAVGTGDFANAAQATAAEVAIKIQASIADAVASSASSRVRITSAASGASATVRAVGGTLLNTLRFADSTTAVANLATGTGVQEDFADAAWMGRCITFDLDAAGGAALWDKQELKTVSPTGAGVVVMKGDIFDPATAKTDRERLHDTLKVNTYELRLGRNETHFGTLLNDQLGAGGFIDIRTTVDWLDARTTEAFNNTANAAANAKTKYAYGPSGIAVYDGAFRQVLQLAERNGHTVFDDSPLDLNGPATATGIYTPTLADQTQADVNNRRVVGFQARQQVQGGIQRGRVVINLIGPTPGA